MRLIAAAMACLCVMVVPAAAEAATVSGFALRNESSSLPWAACNGLTPTVALRYDTTTYTAPCDPVTGAFSLSPAFTATSRLVTIWMDGVPGSKGALYTRNNGTANITSLELTQDRVRVRSETATILTPGQVDGWDQDAAGGGDTDIPATMAGSDFTLDPNTELHIDAGETFDTSAGVLTISSTSVHVGAGATFIPPYFEVQMSGSGELTDCTRGPGLSMPLCMDAGATIPPDELDAVFTVEDGDAQIPAMQYHALTISGDSDAISGDEYTVHVGTATGQTMSVTWLILGTWWGGPGHVDLSRHAPTISAESVELGDGSSLRSSKPGTIGVQTGISGGGTVDLPLVDVTIDADSPRAWLGANESGSEWKLGSLSVRNSYTTEVFGAGGASTAFDSGAGLDTPTDVLSWYNPSWSDGGYSIAGRDATGGGAWHIQTVRTDGTPAWTQTWNATGGDDRALALADTSSDYTTQLVVGGRIAQNGGDWAIRRTIMQGASIGKFYGVAGSGVDAATPYGNTDLDLNGTNDTYVHGHATGLDEVTAMLDLPNDNILVAGTTWNGTSQQVRIVRLDDAGLEVAPALLYDTPGADYAPSTLCHDQNGQDAYVVGADSTNGGDMFVRGIDMSSGGISWYGIGPDSTPIGTVDTDVNGTNDTLRWGSANAEAGSGCVIVGEHMFAYGTRTTAGNADGFVARVWDDGTFDTAWNAGVPATYDSGTTNDQFTGVFPDPTGYAEGGVLVSATVGTNGGDGALLRYDDDGQLDRSFGTDGVVTWNSGGASSDGFAAMDAADTTSSHVELATLDGSSGSGDIRIRRYDVNGHATDGAPGQVRTFALSGDHEDSASRLTVARDLVVGNASDAGESILDLESVDPLLEVAGNVTVTSRGALQLSSQAPMTLRGDLDNASGGRTLANSGSVRIRPAGASATIRIGAAGGAPTFRNTFAKLDLDLPSTGTPATKEIRLQPVTATVVRSELRARGASCTSNLRVSGTGGTAALDTTGATRFGDWTNVSNVTVTPATWTLPNGSLSGTTTGFAVTAPCGAAPPLPPDTLFVHDTNAQAGDAHSLNVTTATPHFSVVNRTGTTVDQRRVRVYSDTLDGVRHLFHFGDAPPTTLVDSGAAGGSIDTLLIAPAARRPTPSVGGRFGGGLSFDGDDYATTNTGGLSSAEELTFDTWIRRTTAQGGAVRTLVAVGNAGTLRAMMYVTPAGTLRGGFVDGTGANRLITDNDVNVLDGTSSWHHVALVLERVEPGTSIRLVVDGEVVETTTVPQTPRVVAGSQMTLGAAANGVLAMLDDVRMSTRAISADELGGYYRTGRAHGELLWDSGSVSACSTCPLASGARTSDLTYAGPADLRLSGARYWVTTQLRTDATGAPASTWSSWSDPDWFETRISETLTVTTGGTVSLGTVLPGSDASRLVSVDVSTTGGHGYTLYGRAQSDTWTLSSGTTTIAPWSGTAATPTPWPTGAPGAGYAGFSVLAATGGKDPKWGAGTQPTDHGLLNYVGMRKTTDTPLHVRSGYATTTDTIELALRLNPALSITPGTYSGTVTLAALTNP